MKKQAIASYGLAAALIAGSAFAATQAPAAASSHREAPLISRDQFADNTDTYAFVSPDRPDSVTLIGSWIPFEAPQGGPNYFAFADDVTYKLHVDNIGDAKSHIEYQLKFKTTLRNPNTFLYNTGPITSLDDPDWNMPQTYTINEIVNGVTTTLASDVPVPPVNLGPKSIPDFPALMRSAIKNIATPEGEIKIYAGQTDDPFWVDLQVFDLLTLRKQKPPIGYDKSVKGRKPVDGLAGFNVHSIAIQVPIARLLNGAGNNTVLGVWASSARPTTRVLGFGSSTSSGPEIQVSRLGMPLVNEVVLPLALKDAFNSLEPKDDFGLFTSGTPAGELLKKSVLDPELQNLLAGLYGVPKPSGPRNDLLAIFLTGMVTTKPFTINTPNGKVVLPAGTNVNQPANVQPAEMIRLNVAAPFRPNTPGTLCAPKPNYKWGLLAGDACGFPNGRRLQDDVVDIELAAVAGAAYAPLTNDTFSFNTDFFKVLIDSVDKNDLKFQNSFPYLAVPHRGAEFVSEGGTGLSKSDGAKDVEQQVEVTE
jgi:hypothetical protein